MPDTDRDDRPMCAGRTLLGSSCVHRARLGSRFCGTHAEQAPVVPVAGYLVETTAARTRHPGRVHLRYSGGSTLLCTGTPATAEYSRLTGVLKPCPTCRSLALIAVDRGELEPDDLRRFRLGEPNVDERAGGAR